MNVNPAHGDISPPAAALKGYRNTVQEDLEFLRLLQYQIQLPLTQRIKGYLKIKLQLQHYRPSKSQQLLLDENHRLRR
ncbi:hypothetical protein D3C85_1626860 [compost metagenome]